MPIRPVFIGIVRLRTARYYCDFVTQLCDKSMSYQMFNGVTPVLYTITLLCDWKCFHNRLNLHYQIIVMKPIALPLFHYLIFFWTVLLITPTKMIEWSIASNECDKKSETKNIEQRSVATGTQQKFSMVNCCSGFDYSLQV